VATNDVGTMVIKEPVIAERNMTITFTPTLYRAPHHLFLYYHDLEVETEIPLSMYNDVERRNFVISALTSKALKANEIFVKYNQQRGPSLRLEPIGTYLDFYMCLLIVFVLHCHLFYVQFVSY